MLKRNGKANLIQMLASLLSDIVLMSDEHGEFTE